MVEIIREIKESNGSDFAIVALINAAEPGLDQGITPEEGRVLAKILEGADTDAIHARIEFYTKRKSSAEYDSTHFPDVAFYPTPPEYATPDAVDTRLHGTGGWIPVAAEIKKW